MEKQKDFDTNLHGKFVFNRNLFTFKSMMDPRKSVFMVTGPDLPGNTRFMVVGTCSSSPSLKIATNPLSLQFKFKFSWAQKIFKQKFE